MTRAHYHLNLNLDDPNEREVWCILQSECHSSCAAFLMEAILRQGKKSRWRNGYGRLSGKNWAAAAGPPPAHRHGFAWEVSHG